MEQKLTQNSTSKIRLKKKLPKNFCKKFLIGIIPILEWMPKYSLKHDLFNDIITGLTVGIMIVPQCKYFLIKF